MRFAVLPLQSATVNKDDELVPAKTWQLANNRIALHTKGVNFLIGFVLIRRLQLRIIQRDFSLSSCAVGPSSYAKSLQVSPSLLHGGPNTVDVVVVFKGLEELANFGALFVGEL